MREYSVLPSLAHRRFAPALHWTLLAALGVALFVSLGRWQLHRAEEKRALFAGFAAGSGAAVMLPENYRPIERYQRVTASGHYDSSRQFLLDNMTRDGVPGFHVLTPLVQYDSRVVLVDRPEAPEAWHALRAAQPGPLPEAAPEDEALIVATSFPTQSVRLLLQKLPPDLPHHHFGDTDPAGWDILRKLREVSERAVHPFEMRWRPKSAAQPLSPRERQILVRLLGAPSMKDCQGGLQAMLEAGTRGEFEQESLGRPTLDIWPFYRDARL